jgi:hypothetical protein
MFVVPGVVLSKREALYSCNYLVEHPSRIEQAKQLFGAQDRDYVKKVEMVDEAMLIARSKDGNPRGFSYSEQEHFLNEMEFEGYISQGMGDLRARTSGEFSGGGLLVTSGRFEGETKGDITPGIYMGVQEPVFRLNVRKKHGHQTLSRTELLKRLESSNETLESLFLESPSRIVLSAGGHTQTINPSTLEGYIQRNKSE